jgi:hypothetical protein
MGKDTEAIGGDNHWITSQAIKPSLVLFISFKKKMWAKQFKGGWK